MTAETSASAVCATCGLLPDGTPLYPMGPDKVHAVVVREAQRNSYYGPQPEEVEPCGPVTVARTDEGAS